MSSNKNLNYKSFGSEGENLAEKFLKSKGYQIIKRNFRFGRGEIDIIAKDGDCLVFVEVKTRKSLEFGEPEYAITKSKVRQLKKLAEAYFYVNKIEEQYCRFDVICIIRDVQGNYSIKHLENAFY